MPATENIRMRRYTMWSVLLHGLVFLAISIPIARQTPPIFAEPIYQVALVEWPDPNFAPPVPTQAPPKPKVEPQPKPEPKPKPPEPEAVVVPVKKTPEPEPVPEKKEPAPEPVKKNTPPEPVKEPSAQPKVDLPVPPVEPVSLGMVDQRDFKHDYYLELLRGILARAWNPPPAGSGLQRTGIHFIIQRDGTIVSPEVRQASGSSLFDRSALSAVLSVKKLPPLPEAYSGDELGLTANFQLTGDTTP